MDAGGPSAEPPAEGKIEPFDWQAPQSVYQAKQKLEYINRTILVAQTARAAEVGSVQPFMCQRSAAMCVILGNVSGLTPARWTLRRGCPRCRTAISKTFTLEGLLSRKSSRSCKREKM